MHAAWWRDQHNLSSLRLSVFGALARRAGALARWRAEYCIRRGALARWRAGLSPSTKNIGYELSRRH